VVVRAATGLDEPHDLLDASTEIKGTAAATERIVEQVDPSWTALVAAAAEEQRGAIAGGWLARLEEREGIRLPQEERHGSETLQAGSWRFAVRRATRARVM
jgi:hypothetical protein